MLEFITFSPLVRDDRPRYQQVALKQNHIMTKAQAVPLALKSIAFIGCIALVAFASTVSAMHSSEHYNLFGDSSYVSPGNASSRAVHLISDASPGYGGIEYGVESGVTFADLETLSTDYMFEADDSCEGGAPRFQISVTDPDSGDSGNIFAYFGSTPNYNDCPSGVWTNTGDLIGTLPLDTTQLDDGAFYDPYASALAKYGDYEVTEISLVTDAGWAAEDNEQAVTIDNTLLNSTLFTYEIPVAVTKDQCKKGGWQNLADDEGNAFKNQGDCVSFVASQGRSN
jgi:hypothetical protein